MGRVGGYTLIEVMIFLAISGVLFVSAVALIQGQQGRTQFSQSMRDIDSKLTQYVTEISASFFPSTEKYTCSVTPPNDPAARPQLRPVLNSLGNNEDCIFLGKALQFHHDSSDNVDDTLAVYSVLGRRTVVVTASGLDGSTDQTILVPSFSAANPTPAFSLLETYTLPFGTKITSACKDTVSPCNVSAMAGFYVDLSQTSSEVTANKSASLVSYQYPGNVNLNTPVSATSGTAYSCLTLNRTPLCSGLDATTKLPASFTNWILCFKSAASRQKAKITVASGATGIQTKVDFDAVGCTP